MMRSLKILGLVFLFTFLVVFPPRMGFAEDDPDGGTQQMKHRTGYKVPDWYQEWREKAKKLEVPKGVTFPTRFDWRDSNGVTIAKNQGDCGSCWAFAALGALEAMVAIHGEVHLDLSEQQIVSCKTYGSGCDGAYMELAYQLFRMPGSVDEGCMPYQASHWIPCTDDTCEKWAKISGWDAVTNIVEDLKYAIYNYGPVGVAMAACDEFQGYAGGCFDYPCIGINHAVLLVGWDDTIQCGDVQGAWIGKNSWGQGWGPYDGFFYIKYNCSMIGTDASVIYYVFHRPYVRLEEYGVDDSSPGGDGDGMPERGETVRLDFTLKNLWSPLGEVEVTVTADTEGIVITDDYSYLGDMDSKDILDNSSDPMEFYVPDDFPVRRTYFTFHVSGDSGGGVTYTADTTVEVWVGKVEILVVDDDQGTDQYSNVENYFINALDSLGAIYHVWDKMNQPDTFYHFSDYEIVIWFTGDSRDSIFSDADIESLMTFLDNGGGLFLTSQDAVEVLSSGDALRQQFLANYLHVGYGGNAEEPLVPLVQGDPGDEVGDTLWIKPWGAGGANNQTSRDVLIPDSEADTVLVYANIGWIPSDSVAGTKFQNDYFKVVLFGFGFEAIYSGTFGGRKLSNPHFVIQRVMDWLKARPINMIYPNGGEDFFVGDTCEILWECNSFEDSVQIEYSIDAGAEWSTIVESTTCDGFYSWIIPDTLTSSNNCLVRIKDVDNGIPCDTSDGDFSIRSYVYGDANGDGEVNLADAVYIVNYLFIGAPPPDPLEAGDANCSGDVDLADAVYIINYLFIGGPSPGCP